MQIYFHNKNLNQLQNTASQKKNNKGKGVEANSIQGKQTRNDDWKNEQTQWLRASKREVISSAL